MSREHEGPVNGGALVLVNGRRITPVDVAVGAGPECNRVALIDLDPQHAIGCRQHGTNHAVRHLLAAKLRGGIFDETLVFQEDHTVTDRELSRATLSLDLNGAGICVAKTTRMPLFKANTSALVCASTNKASPRSGWPSFITSARAEIQSATILWCADARSSGTAIWP